MNALCPGSFDPITLGHVDIFHRAAFLADELTILVTVNPNKQGFFSPEERMEFIWEATAHLDNVRVEQWTGLLVDYTEAHDIEAVIKGLRTSQDFDYELPMAQMNQELAGVDTLFLTTNPKLGYVSSTLIKEVARLGGDVSNLVTPAVAAAFAARLE